MILDLFAGPGGWDQGFRTAGHTGPLVGVEHDLDACRTAVAAGHGRICADVTGYPAERLHGRLTGLVISPPCQAWSRAGKGLGLFDQPAVVEHVLRVERAGRWVDYPRTGWYDDRSPLVLEVLRWVLLAEPPWFACEQVADVAPFWSLLARVLRDWGYSTSAGVLHAEEYGVPQTRDRAVLVGALGGVAALPVPTHQRYRPGESAREAVRDLFGADLLPWVSMADALGWDVSTVVRSNYGTGGDPAARGERRGCEPAAAVTGKVGRNVVMRNGSQINATRRTGSEPAATVHCSRPGNLSWVHDRPATTVCGDPRIGRPGHKDRDGGESQFGAGSTRVTVAEAGVLQGFPADYPWQGTKTARYRQVGDAVPPPLAAAVVAPLLSTSLRAAS